MLSSRRRLYLCLLITSLLASACQAQKIATTPTPSASLLSPTPPAAQSTMNPLTGQPALDPRLLKIPAVLVSISNFPAIARPQSGLSFAPFVYEFYITEGATRFLAVFYGQFPAPESPLTGGCETRTAPFVQNATVLGNRVWMDANNNGIQDPGEEGVGGLCVNLYDSRGELIDRTSSDSNGYYGFNVSPGRYTVEFVRPPAMQFSPQHATAEDSDSDPDPATGQATVDVSSDTLAVDAGLVQSTPAPKPEAPDSSALAPPAQVGPIRSGRLIYHYIANYFQNSCLIFGSASPEVLVHLPKCLTVFHELAGGGFMLDLSEMEQVARENASKKGSDFNYESNTYAAQVPEGGAPARSLHEYFAYQNQSAWDYDPLYQGYIHYVDTSEYAQAGVLYPDTDRLTGRQLHVDNIIVLFAKHEVVGPTNLDIHLDPGKSGPATLFRDGMAFQARWQTDSLEEQAAIGVRPIHFLRPDGTPLPLKPGHTWIVVVTPETSLKADTPGQWNLYFFMPQGAN